VAAGIGGRSVRHRLQGNAETVPRYWSDEPPISAEEFTVRIELVNVSMPSDGKTFILWFTDGEMEMFGGHIIEASFGADTNSGARTGWVRHTAEPSAAADWRDRTAFRGSTALQPRQLLSFVVRRFWFSMMRNLVSSLEP
jgi:hypothetical protein